MNIYKKIISFVALTAILITGISYATALPLSIPSTFETYLANQQASTDTTLTVASLTLADGTTLTGFQCLTIDGNTPSQEFECGTVSTTTPDTIVNLARGLDSQTGTTTIAALEVAHRRGADVKVTDYPVLTIIDRMLGGIDGFTNTLGYASSMATSTIAASRNNFASVGLLDDTAFSGAGIINATTMAKGVIQLATAFQAASSTAIGSSGASLVLPASIATDTSGTAESVVMTNPSGQINSNFLNIATTSSFSGGSGIPLMTIGKNVWIATTSTSTFLVPTGVSVVSVWVVGSGAGGSDSGGAGGNGATSTFSSFLIASGGTAAQSSSNSVAGSGIKTASSILTLSGQAGTPGLVSSSTPNDFGWGTYGWGGHGNLQYSGGGSGGESFGEVNLTGTTSIEVTVGQGGANSGAGSSGTSGIVVVTY